MSEHPEPVTSADDLYAGLTARPLAEAQAQADEMIAAATSVLIERQGVEGTLTALANLMDHVRRMRPAAPAPAPAQPADLVGPALAYLRGLPVGQACTEADAVIRAASTFLGEVFERGTPVAAPAAPTTPAAVLPEQLACALVDQLRTLDRGEAHERARATVVGAAAYLHEAFGRSYAAALINGTLQAAAEYGDAMRGGRDSLDTLH